MRPAALLLLLLAPALAFPQARPEAWLDTPAAKEFRDRVVLLAVLYESSAGIDPEGYRIETRLLGRDAAGCPLVEVRTLRDGEPVRSEQVTACAAKLKAP